MPLWVDASEVSGALAASVGLIGGTVISLYYGSKANVAIAAEAFRSGSEVVLAARPSVNAVGFYRLKFETEDGAYLRVTEVRSDSTGLKDGAHWDARAIFGTSFVDGGETLMTTTLFSLPLPPDLVGWRCSFGIKVKRFPRASDRVWAWADQVFVPCPVANLDTEKRGTA